MMKKNLKKKTELLAPAGTVEAFEAAVRHGADAVYIGAPALNARALARNFSLADMAAMTAYAHERGVKVYVAMNSLMKEEEIPLAVEILAGLESLAADAVIIQDLGIYSLIRKYFPGLRIHASTLMGAHNSLAVREFERLGFSRVVLAREMTLAEISRFHKVSPVELEVFVQGAMCFSYSGLCLFSSYLGGKSGLRGRCVQPCRRRYTWKEGKTQRSGYLFSMNDLCAIDLLPELKEAGIASLKIEGRMRSAQYVGSVVKAYRMALDADPGDKTALGEARQVLALAMGRKTFAGYFQAPQPLDAVSPQHSGNIGLFLGKAEKARQGRFSLLLREAVRRGDRLRIHLEKSGERQGFTLKKLMVRGKEAEAARPGARVHLELPLDVHAGDSLYKVDVAERRGLSARRSVIDPKPFEKKLKKRLDRPWINRIVAGLHLEGRKKQNIALPHGRRRSSGRGKMSSPLPLWLKVEDLRLVQQRLPVTPQKIVVVLTPESYARFGRMRKAFTPYRRKLLWALPPVILEQDLEFYAEAIRALARNGFLEWQIGHVSQLRLFESEDGNGRKPAAAKAGRSSGRKRTAGPFAAGLAVHADYTINVLNSLAQRFLKEAGIGAVQAAIETDRDNLRKLAQHRQGLLGITVYGAPPLFTARLWPAFSQPGQTLLSPKREAFVLQKKWGQTIATAVQPFSLLPYLDELADLGLGYGVIDLSSVSLAREGLQTLFRQLAGPRRGKKRLSTFNYLGGIR